MLPAPCLQGAHSRRNYTALFSQLATRPDILSQQRFQIQTYTWGPLDPKTIPPAVLPKVTGKNHLKFQVWHRIGHQQTLWCPAPQISCLAIWDA